MLKLKSLLFIIICYFSLSLYGMELHIEHFNQDEFEEGYSELVCDNDPNTKKMYQQAAEYLLSAKEFDNDVIEKFIQQNALEEFIEQKTANQLDKILEKKETHYEQFSQNTEKSFDEDELQTRLTIFGLLFSDLLEEMNGGWIQYGPYDSGQ